jgi:hypothetical protein
MAPGFIPLKLLLPRRNANALAVGDWIREEDGVKHLISSRAGWRARGNKLKRESNTEFGGGSALGRSLTLA